MADDHRAASNDGKVLLVYKETEATTESQPTNVGRHGQGESVDDSPVTYSSDGSNDAAAEATEQSKEPAAAVRGDDEAAGPAGNIDVTSDRGPPSTGTRDEQGRLQRTRQPPGYLRDYVRTVRESPSTLTPSEVGYVAWFDRSNQSFVPCGFIPFPVGVTESGRLQLTLQFEMHIGWLNINNNVFVPLARLPYPPTAFNQTACNAIVSYVQCLPTTRTSTINRQGWT